MVPISAAVLALALAQAAPAPAAEPDRLRRTDIPIALVLSGGVSLGSYEAGLSWAVVRFSRDASSVDADARGAPRLLAVTGASAGSVNALLSAILWCTEPGSDEDSVDRNLLHDLWLSLGLDGLLPDRSDGYMPGDALMSTRPLLDAFHQFQLRVSGATAAHRFRPGCRLPIGLTVTRASAAEHEVGGLRLRTQRFALTWRLEVGPDGVPRVVPQRLGQGEQRPDILDIPPAGGAELGTALSWPQAVQAMLASAAFPLAFRARELCDCSTRCPLESQVKTGTCEGPLGPMSNLSCPARSPDGEPLTLCSHRYVDGGIFDNTPVGLGVELTQSMATTQPLQPLTYVYIDPDLRRLTPAPSQTPAAPATPGTRALRDNLEELARIASELVATARTEDLSRTLRSGPWNVTTRDLLYATAASLTSFATVERDAAARLGRPSSEPAPALGEAQPSAALRGPLGRALLRCFPERPPDPAAERACARELTDVLAGRIPPGEASPPTEEEVMRLAEAMRHAANEMLLRDRPIRSAQGAELFAHRMRVGAVGMTFLANEMTRVARSNTPEPVLKQFRGALLDTIQLGRAYGVEAAHQANAAVLEQLGALRADPASGAAATQASATILAAPDVVFLPDELEGVLNTVPRTPSAREALRAIVELAGVAPVLQNEIVRLSRFAREAQALQQTRAERALILSSRFAPITGAQLGHFGAFLDRPFREYDYIAGVYDASRAIAVRLCEAEAIAGAPRAVRNVRSSNEIDLHALDTQRCLGTALQTVFGELDVESSGTAAHVFRTLARTELDASLDAADAARLAAEPAWAWVNAPARTPPDRAVATVADVLLSPRVECAPGATSSCIRELAFDEFLSALRARNYEPTDLEMRELVDDTDAWTRRTLRRLVDRSYERELARPASPDVAPAILAAHGVGEMWLRGRSAVGPFPQLRLDPSTIPPRLQTTSLDARRVVAHLIPFRIDLDVARGGVSASWLDPTLWLGPRASVALELTPISYASERGRFSSSLALLPTLHAAGLAFGVGPKGAVRWSGGGTTAGALLRVAAFQQRLSVSVGTDSFSAGGGAVFVTIGVADLNGAFFWLLGG